MIFSLQRYKKFAVFTQKFGFFCTFARKYLIIMRKLLTFVAVLLLAVPVTGKTSENDVIGKSNIKLSSRMMTPEALWAMGRIGSYEASPDGQHVVYQVGYLRDELRQQRQQSTSADHQQ